MLGSWRHKCLLFTLVALILLSSSSTPEASRALPKDLWEQMLPKKLPIATPSSAPSKGTNSATKSSSKPFEARRNLPSSEGKV
ncbi:hypothetical protein ACLB2K_012527 [Fragaria x ananassa]